MSYAQKKLYEAVYCLVSEGPLRKRLDFAAHHIIQLQPQHFANSEDLKAWERIRESVTWAPADYEGEGQIESTTRRMIDQDASQAAEDILALFLALSGGWQK